MGRDFFLLKQDIGPNRVTAGVISPETRVIDFLYLGLPFSTICRRADECRQSPRYISGLGFAALRLRVARILIAPRAKHLSRPASAVCSRAGYPRRVRQVTQATADDRVDGGVGTTPVLASVSRTAAVDVFEPNDVILVEIGSRLDLDKEGRDLSGISEPMLLTNPNEGGLVFGE